MQIKIFIKLVEPNKNTIKRLNQYPKESVLLIQMRCSDCICIEKYLIQKFRGKFKQCTDIGRIF